MDRVFCIRDAILHLQKRFLTNFVKMPEKI